MRKKGRSLWAILLVLGVMFVSGCKEKSDKNIFSQAQSLPNDNPWEIKPVAGNWVRPFSLKDVRLLEGPFKANQERDREYLHSLDPDRLLHNFRINAGLPSKAEPLGGWEKPDVELRGHTVGHYLSACAMRLLVQEMKGSKKKQLI